MWEDLDEFGHLPTMTAEQRALQWRRLEGLGEEPTQEELGDMRWPQRCCGGKTATKLVSVPVPLTLE